MNETSNLPEHVAAPNPKAIQNADLSKGEPIAALVPKTLDDTFRLAKALASAGDMVPQHFQNKPEATMAAIVRGMEIGLAPMQALSNIAVINGRASIWGDALPAIVQRHGHTVDVVIEGEGASMKAIATLIRGDTGAEIVRDFSMADAQRAGLTGKKGPWQQYPKRMLAMRARSWAVRDGAADCLMGLQVAEEMQDVPMRDVTPKPGGFAAKAMAAKTADQDSAGSPDDSSRSENAQTRTGSVDDAEQQDQPEKIEGEVLTHWTDAVDTKSAFPTSEPFHNGAQAYQDGVARTECPHETSLDDACDWLGGWDGAKQSAEYNEE